MSIEYVDTEIIYKYFFKPKSIAELKSSATVIIDTNVLLSAYQWKEVTLREVLDTLYNLSSQLRLKIPSHVIKEFMDQRPKRIVETNQKIERELLSKIQKPPKLVSIVPFIDLVEESREYFKAETEFLKHYENYRKKILEISNHVKSFINSDPVLDTLERLIVDCYFELIPEEMSNIEDETKERVKQKLPPLSGGDKGKKENFDGDFIIWKHILSVNSDVIFVTSDAKEDWVIKDHHSQVLSPRRELVEEFFIKTKGKTFSILSPKDFVALFKPNLNDAVAEDLLKEETKRSVLFGFLKNLFNKYDPLGVYSLTQMEDEYSNEIDAFISRLPEFPTHSEINYTLFRVIEEYFGKGEAHQIKHLKEMTNDISIYYHANSPF